MREEKRRQTRRRHGTFPQKRCTELTVQDGERVGGFKTDLGTTDLDNSRSIHFVEPIESPPVRKKETTLKITEHFIFLKENKT